MTDPLSPAGAAAVAELAQRYRVGEGAAQFSHPDLGGNGQWMRGGMTMVGDMFNPGLQATVSSICSELSTRLASGDALVTPGPTGSSWWPADLGRPSTSGGQNDAAYAYFPGPRRLAIRRGPAVTVYDTGEHAISGVQQQQGGRGSLEFSSQLGTFTVDRLAVVGASRPGPDPGAEPAGAAPEARPGRQPASASPGARPAPTAEIGAAIETLAGLRDKGFLTEAEFAAKKAELLARL